MFDFGSILQKLLPNLFVRWRTPKHFCSKTSLGDDDGHSGELRASMGKDMLSDEETILETCKKAFSENCDCASKRIGYVKQAI